MCVHFSDLNERAVIAVPDDALHSTLWTLLEPGAQLLEGNRWRVSDSNTPVWHQEVDRLLLNPQSCQENET